MKLKALIRPYFRQPLSRCPIGAESACSVDIYHIQPDSNWRLGKVCRSPAAINAGHFSQIVLQTAPITEIAGRTLP
jgi:hypothetical protein